MECQQDIYLEKYIVPIRVTHRLILKHNIHNIF